MLIFKNFATFLTSFVGQSFLRRLAKSLSFQIRFFEPCYFSRLLRIASLFFAKISAPHYFSRSSVSQGFLRGSQSRMRLGKENKPGLVFFSLSFVFGRFES
jgi:hypothetical protein